MFLKFILLLISAIFMHALSANDHYEYVEQYHASIDATEIKLKNGLKVFIKRTDFDAGEVNVQLLAPNGYSSLLKENRPSGILSSKIAFESGVGKYIGPKLPYKLYNESIDLTFSIEKSHRVIDINTFPESIDHAFIIIQNIFLDSHVNKDVFKKIIDKEKRLMQDYSSNPTKNLEAASFSLNTDNHFSVRPLAYKDIGKVDLHKSREIFNSFFGDPSEFYAIIIGDINVDLVKKSVVDKLGKIQKKSIGKSLFSKATIPSFPEGITRKVILSENVKGSLSRITLPIKMTFSKENIEVIQFFTSLLEKRLRKQILKEMGKNFGVDIGYEMPLYPSKDVIWLNVQFHSEKHQIEIIEKMILKDLEFLSKNKIDKQEFESAIKGQLHTESFWKKTNSYWQNKIASYCLCEWELDTNNAKEFSKSFTVEDLQKFVKSAIDLENYSIVTLQS